MKTIEEQIESAEYTLTLLKNESVRRDQQIYIDFLKAKLAALKSTSVIVHVTRDDAEKMQNQMSSDGTLTETARKSFDLLLNSPNVIWAEDEN